MKKVIIVVLLVVAMLCVSCEEAYLPPNVEIEVYQNEAFVAELNRRCQAGDPNACSEGLDRAAKVLTLIVDALEGEGSAE